MAERIEIEIILDDGSIKNGFVRVEKQAKKTGNRIGTALTAGFAKIGGRLLALGATFAAAFALRKVINDLKGFQLALTEITTITKLSAKETKALGNQLIALSAQFGTTAQEQAKSFYTIISAGVTDAVKANDLLIASNKLAIGGLTTNVAAIDILTTAVNAFASSGLTASKAADILFSTVRLGKVTTEELASSLGQVLPSAQALGVSFEEVNAGLAALTLKGDTASLAVTKLSAILTAVLKKQDTAKELGIEVAEAFSLQALRTKGLTLFLKDLNQALGGSETKLVKLLGRAEGAKAIISLAADNFKKMADNVRELSGKNVLGAADIAFQKINTTIQQKLNIAGATFNAILLKISSSTTGPFAAALDSLNKGLSFVFRNLDRLSIGFLEFKIALLTLKQDILKFIFDITLLAQKSEILKNALSFAGVDPIGILGQIRETHLALNEAISEQNLLLQSNAELSSIAGAAAKDAAKETVDGMKKTKAATVNVADSLKKAFGDATVQLFRRFGEQMNGVQDAFRGFGDAIKNILGDMLISVGKALVLNGLGIEALKAALIGLTGGIAIAAGAALIIAGGALKQSAGQSLAAAATSTAGGTVAPTPDVAADEVQDIADTDTEKTTEVTVNISGDVLDSEDTGLRIVEIINDAFDKQGVVIKRQAVA